MDCGNQIPLMGERETSYKVGLLLILILDLIWVLSSEITEYLLSNNQYNKPFILTYFNSIFLILGLLIYQVQKCKALLSTSSNPKYLPLNQQDEIVVSDEVVTKVDETDDIVIKFGNSLAYDSMLQKNCQLSVGQQPLRLDFSQGKDSKSLSNKSEEQHNKNPWSIVWIAPIFTLLYFFQNYSYNLALSKTAPSIVNVVSSVSGLFVLMFGSLIHSTTSDPDGRLTRSVETFTFSKLFFATLTVLGVVVISFSDVSYEMSSLIPKKNSTSYGSIRVANASYLLATVPYQLTTAPITSHPVLRIPWGVIWSLVGAIFYALYCVLLRRYPEEQLQHGPTLSLFVGCVGAWAALLLLPGIPILNFLGLEPFELPSTPTEWSIILSTGLLGSLLSNYIYLKACLLTSPLTVTLGMTLSIPMTIVYDVIVSRSHFPVTFFVGTVPILISFVGISVVNSSG